MKCVNCFSEEPQIGAEMMETSLLPPPTVVIHFPPLEPAQLKEAVAIA